LRLWGEFGIDRGRLQPEVRNGRLEDGKFEVGKRGRRLIQR
jgi:hypothetical protein